MSILVATDFSENSYASIRTANRLATKFKTELRVLHVVDLTGDDNAWRILYETTDEIEKNAGLEAAQQLRELYAKIIPKAEQIEFSTPIRFGMAAAGVAEEIKADRPTLIVVGTLGQSRLKNVFFGHTSNHLVRETNIPLLAIPPDFSGADFEKILVAIDFSECSKLALGMAAQVAETFGAKLEALHAINIDKEINGLSLSHLMHDMKPEIDNLLEERAAELKDWATEAGAGDQVSEYHIKGIRADAAIQSLAEEGAFDLIVMGTHGRRGFARWFLGSTAERVLRQTELPVLVVSNPE